MPKITNWSKTVERPTSRVGISGTVREWEHDETGETVAVVYVDDDEAGYVWYGLEINGETDIAFSTLNQAREEAVEYMRDFPSGFEPTVASVGA